MPELPDVEVYKQYLDATALHKTVRHTHVRDERILEHSSARSLQQRLKGRRIEHSRRHGKFLFAELDDQRALVLHFGMTGDLSYYTDDDTPRYAQVILDFDEGHLAFESKRKIGHIGLVDDVEQYIKDHALGPDAMALDVDAFCAAADSRAAVKSWLMDQKKLAGIGNEYSDEILFQAGINPKRKVSSLERKELKKLHQALQKVVKEAVKAKVDPTRMPRNFLLPHREPGANCPGCKGKIRKETIAGRSAYWCPKCQK